MRGREGLGLGLGLRKRSMSTSSTHELHERSTHPLVHGGAQGLAVHEFGAGKVEEVGAGFEVFQSRCP